MVIGGATDPSLPVPFSALSSSTHPLDLGLVAVVGGTTGRGFVVERDDDAIVRWYLQRTANSLGFLGPCKKGLSQSYARSRNLSAVARKDSVRHSLPSATASASSASATVAYEQLVTGAAGETGGAVAPAGLVARDCRGGPGWHHPLSTTAARSGVYGWPLTGHLPEGSPP
jgi:hypothetical protein